MTTYKLGWKTSYYQNTYDSKKDEDEATPVGWQDNVPEEKRKRKRIRGLVRVLYNINELRSANTPYIKCWVRKEYLHDLEKGHGELVEAVILL